jgi:hypothetical protein
MLNAVISILPLEAQWHICSPDKIMHFFYDHSRYKKTKWCVTQVSAATRIRSEPMVSVCTYLQNCKVRQEVSLPVLFIWNKW